MRNTNEQSLGDVIKQLIRTYRFEDKIAEVRITSAWEKVMGPQIHSLTNKLVFKDQTLTVYLRSAPLREELYMAKTKIIDMINKEVGHRHVKELILR
jgi:predicted nucleic acid-binding Zn ribbon protein